MIFFFEVWFWSVSQKTRETIPAPRSHGSQRHSIDLRFTAGPTEGEGRGGGYCIGLFPLKTRESVVTSRDKITDWISFFSATYRLSLPYPICIKPSLIVSVSFYDLCLSTVFNISEISATNKYQKTPNNSIHWVSVAQTLEP